jgi:hypothetical protein
VTSSSLTSEPVARVLSRVHGAKRDRDGWRARCPAHQGKSDTSLSIAQGDDGRVLLKCFSGCSHRSIAEALGLSATDLFPPRQDAAWVPTRPPRAEHAPREFATAREAADAYRATHGPEAARWTYRDPSGDPIGLVLRWDREDGSKTIRPAWRIGRAWRQSYPDARPLYALDRLAEAPEARVFVAEGEKCAEVLWTLGLQATTSPAGAQAAGKADWSPLAGREVVILPDADDPGRKYAEEVRAAVEALDPPARVSIAALPRLEPGEDVVEFVGRVHGGDLKAAREAIEALAAKSSATAPRKWMTLGEVLADPRTLAKPETIASGWWPWEDAQPFGAVERGTVNAISAPPGAYKTSTMLRAMRGFAESGHRAAWLAAEMRRATLVRRMLCQAAGIGQGALASGSLPPDHARRIEEARRRLDELGERMRFADAPIGFGEIEEAAESADVVFLDYLQLVRHPDPEVRGHERIEATMAKIAECAQRTGAVFIVASAQGREGGDEEREIHNATRGSSSIEFTVDALYCAGRPKQGPEGLTVEFRCLKQREGERRNLVVPIDGRTGLIAEEVAR